jgi:tetratricopeptide (TPR) repeat protein
LTIFGYSVTCHENAGSNNQLAPTGNQKMPDDQPLSEVVIPPPAVPPPDTKKSEASPTGLWDRIKSWGKIAVAIAAIFAGIPTAIGGLIVGLSIFVSLLVLTFHRNSIDLDAIGVPETLTKAGFTSEVATRHLRDAIYAVQQRAKTTLARDGVDTDQDLSGITIPKSDLSLQNVAVALRGLLPGWRHEVSGEFVHLDNGLLLRLRFNGKPIFTQTAKKTDPDAADALFGKVDANAADALLGKADADEANGLRCNADPGATDALVGKDGCRTGAFRIVEETQPFVAASALYGDGKGDPTDAEKELDHIIYGAEDKSVSRSFINLNRLTVEAGNELYFASALYIAAMYGDLTAADEGEDHDFTFVRSTNENVIRAVNMKGGIALDHHEYGKAEIWFKKLPKFSIARYNLGKTYFEREKPDLDLAIVEFGVAIRLDPTYAPPHNYLGIIYYDKYKKTSDQNNLEKAIAEYKIAIDLDPKSEAPHTNLGNIYSAEYVKTSDEYQREKAIAEYQTAIWLDPTDAIPHVNLGNLYYNESRNTSGEPKLEMAIAEYETAIRLDPTEVAARDNLVLSLRFAGLSGTDAEREKRLEAACGAIVEGSKLASVNSDYPARTYENEIDSLMNGHGHCPPTPLQRRETKTPPRSLHHGGRTSPTTSSP